MLKGVVRWAVRVGSVRQWACGREASAQGRSRPHAHCLSPCQSKQIWRRTYKGCLQIIKSCPIGICFLSFFLIDQYSKARKKICQCNNIVFVFGARYIQSTKLLLSLLKCFTQFVEGLVSAQLFSNVLML